MVPQRANPLLAGTPTPPAGLMACDVGGSAFRKCRRPLNVLLTQRGPLVAFALERVQSVIKLLAAFLRLLAGSLQADVRICAQADPMTAAPNRVSKEPRPS
jgi:hypothetical protein